jgi:hypothetical protein
MDTATSRTFFLMTSQVQRLWHLVMCSLSVSTSACRPPPVDLRHVDLRHVDLRLSTFACRPPPRAWTGGARRAEVDRRGAEVDGGATTTPRQVTEHAQHRARGDDDAAAGNGARAASGVGRRRRRGGGGGDGARAASGAGRRRRRGRGRSTRSIGRGATTTTTTRRRRGRSTRRIGRGATTTTGAARSRNCGSWTAATGCLLSDLGGYRCTCMCGDCVTDLMHFAGTSSM